MDNKTISGYTNDDVILVLKEAFENALNDREVTSEILEDIKTKINDKSPDSLFLLEKANHLLETNVKNNDILVKLAGVMQRLQTNIIIKTKKNEPIDFRNIINSIEEAELVNKSITSDIKALEPHKEEEKITINDLRT